MSTPQRMEYNTVYTQTYTYTARNIDLMIRFLIRRFSTGPYDLMLNIIIHIKRALM